MQKAPLTHSHTVSTLPVSSQQINSTSYIPTSALIYSMDERITALEEGGSETWISYTTTKSSSATFINSIVAQYNPSAQIAKLIITFNEEDDIYPTCYVTGIIPPLNNIENTYKMRLNTSGQFEIFSRISTSQSTPAFSVMYGYS